MKHIKKFNEGWGAYRGPKLPGAETLLGDQRYPNWDDIKDILKGLSITQVLKWTPPSKRISLSRTEESLRDKKIKILKKYNCPDDWVNKPLTKDELLKWMIRDSKRFAAEAGKIGIRTRGNS